MFVGVRDLDNCTVEGRIRDLRESIIFKAMGLCSGSSTMWKVAEQGADIKISRSGVEEMVKIEVDKGLSDKEVIDAVMGRLKESAIE